MTAFMTFYLKEKKKISDEEFDRLEKLFDTLDEILPNEDFLADVAQLRKNKI